MELSEEERNKLIQQAKEHLETPLPGHTHYNLNFYDSENEWMNEIDQILV